MFQTTNVSRPQTSTRVNFTSRWMKIEIEKSYFLLHNSDYFFIRRADRGFANGAEWHGKNTGGKAGGSLKDFR